MSTGASAASAASSLTSAASTSNDKSRKTIAQNFDAFLSLLTTQLKNQNPLEPLDANQFTQQLVQFSGVEQQLKSNDLLASIAQKVGAGTDGSNGKLTAASAASLIGTKVSVEAKTAGVTKFVNNRNEARYEVKWPVTLNSNYNNYQATITNAEGKVVYRGAWSPSASTGEETFTWNGNVPIAGVKFDPNQSYTLQMEGSLIADPDKKSIMKTETSGIVNAVDLSGSEEMVQFGDYTFPLSKIKKVAKATP